MQPIVAKYDADRWYSEVMAFVLFGRRSSFFSGTPKNKKAGSVHSRAGKMSLTRPRLAQRVRKRTLIVYLSPKHPTKQEVRLCTTKYQLT